MKVVAYREAGWTGLAVVREVLFFRTRKRLYFVPTC